MPAPSEIPDLKAPEWAVFTRYNPALNGEDFRLRQVTPPSRNAPLISQVVLVERLREVRALVGFTRLDPVGELSDPDLSIQLEPAPLTRPKHEATTLNAEAARVIEEEGSPS